MEVTDMEVTDMEATDKVDIKETKIISTKEDKEEEVVDHSIITEVEETSISKEEANHSTKNIDRFIYYLNLQILFSILKYKHKNISY